jgi:hypothetical protein
MKDPYIYPFEIPGLGKVNFLVTTADYGVWLGYEQIKALGLRKYGKAKDIRGVVNVYEGVSMEFMTLSGKRHVFKTDLVKELFPNDNNDKIPMINARDLAEQTGLTVAFIGGVVKIESHSLLFPHIS